jgi:hypothetical protein
MERESVGAAREIGGLCGSTRHRSDAESMTLCYLVGICSLITMVVG